jgi:hypothetical protein
MILRLEGRKMKVLKLNQQYSSLERSDSPENNANQFRPTGILVAIKEDEPGQSTQGVATLVTPPLPKCGRGGKLYIETRQTSH